MLQVKIPIVDIKKIIKRKVLGIFNSALEILTIDMNYNFCSFQDRDTAYERIFALWKVSSPHAKNASMDGEENEKNLEMEKKINRKATIVEKNGRASKGTIVD